MCRLKKLIAVLRVRLEATTLKAGKEAALRFTLTDADSGAPVSDLEPFLGAPGHVLLVNADLTRGQSRAPRRAGNARPRDHFQP